MAQITPEQRVLLRMAQVPAGLQRRYEASLADGAAVHSTLSEMSQSEDASGYMEGVTAIIVPPRSTTHDQVQRIGSGSPDPDA